MLKKAQMRLGKIPVKRQIPAAAEASALQSEVLPCHASECIHSSSLHQKKTFQNFE